MYLDYFYVVVAVAVVWTLNCGGAMEQTELDGPSTVTVQTTKARPDQSQTLPFRYSLTGVAVVFACRSFASVCHLLAS